MMDHDSGVDGPAVTTSTPSDGVWNPQRIAVTLDEQRIAWVVPATTSGDTSQAGLWSALIEEGPIRLSEEVPDTNVVFDPTGAYLAFGASHAGNFSLVVMGLKDGTTRRHAIDGVVELLCWSDDLLVLIAEEGADAASLTSGTPLTSAGTWFKSSAQPRGWRRVCQVDVASGTVHYVSPANLTVWEFCALPGGLILAVTSRDPSEDGWYRPVLQILGPAPGDQRELFVSSWQIASVVVDPSGRRAAFHEGWTSDRGLGNGEIRIIDLDSGQISEVQPFAADVTALEWARDGRLWFAGWQGTGCAWGWIDEVGATSQSVTLVADHASLFSSSWHPHVLPLAGPRALSVRSTLTEPPEVVVLSTSSAPIAITHFNEGVSADRGFSMETLTWRHDGVEVEGLFAVSTHTETPVALVVDIHGGPSLTYHYGWHHYWVEWLTMAGYAVLLPNPFGGTGRGQEYGRSNLHDPAGTEYQQIVAGVDFLVATGRVPPDRAISLGASYGGYLTAWSVALGDAFRGGVVIAGISHLQSCWGTANNPSFYEFLCGGSPLVQPQLYAERSPVNHISPSSVPALILHGELDQCVPVSQAHQLFTSLSRAGVSVDLVVYPGEGHQAVIYDNICDQRRRVRDFITSLL